MENKTNLTPLHCIFYIYQTFAYGSDGKLTEKEKQLITNFMYRWVGQNKEKMALIRLQDKEMVEMGVHPFLSFMARLHIDRESKK